MLNPMMGGTPSSALSVLTGSTGTEFGSLTVCRAPGVILRAS